MRLVSVISFPGFVAFEFSAGLLGLLLLWGIEGTLSLRWEMNAFTLGMGISFLLPLLVFIVFATSPLGLRMGPLRRIYEMIETSFLGKLILESTTARLALLSLAAGWGEEVLFRGALQSWWGLWGTSLVFGLFHALSFTYFLVAFLMGLYLGSIYQFMEANLFVPVFVHVAYDFAALLLYRRRMWRRPPVGPEPESTDGAAPSP